jgi:hypothetical protein
MRETALIVSRNPEKIGSARLGPGDGVPEPGPGVGPVPVSGGPRQAEGGGRILDRQPGEVTQFHHLGGDGILGGQVLEGRIQGEQLFVRNLGFGRDIGSLDPVTVAAVLVGSLTAGGVHQNAAHGLRGGEEVPAVLPADRVSGADQAEVRLVDQGRRLQCLVGGFGRHARRGEFAQLVVDERQQVGGGLAVARRGGVKQKSHVGHGKYYVRSGHFYCATGVFSPACCKSGFALYNRTNKR